MIFYLDCDGTLWEHEYPKIGRENFGCMPVILKLQKAGHEIILNTYRADADNGTLQEAQDRLNMNLSIEVEPIELYEESKINPSEWDWPTMLKEGIIFIDDITPNIPLKPCAMIEGTMVDWHEIDKQFKEHGIY